MTPAISLILRQSDFFTGLTDQELSLLASVATIRHYAQDDIIFSENQQANDFYLLHKGTVNLVFSSKKIIKVTPLQIFGDWAIVNNTVRLATAVAKDATETIAIDGRKMMDGATIPHYIALKIVLRISAGLVERLQEQSQVSSQILIAQGETDKTEFKSTLRMNLFTGKKDPAIENAVLKTIAAFLNTKGGVLFIGVNDTGVPTGLHHDGFDSEDKFLQHLFHIMADRMGKAVIGDIHPVIVNIQNVPIVRIDVEPSFEPVFVRDQNQTEIFYIRSGVSTMSYSIREAINYIKLRF